MTAELFLKFHGEQWMPLCRTQMFKDLIELLRTSDPARALPGVDSVAATDHAQHLIGRIAGFNLAVNTLEKGIVPPEAFPQPEVEYSDPQDE